MQLNSLRYLVALEREQHFARAASACNVSQPSLSAGISALEEQLGRRLVERDRRFIGLTPEGRAVLPWARQAIAAHDGLIHAASTGPGVLRGELKVGAIPASVPVVGALARELNRSFPELRLSIASLTSREIADGLQRFALDAGITYIEHEPPAAVTTVPLYRERPMFVTKDRPECSASETITWETALAQPLCLLHQGMQNRRILDANLARRDLAVQPVATADSYIALLSLVHAGTFSTIVPDSYGPLIPKWARMIPFSDPLPTSAIGLVVPERSPLSALAAAALTIANRVANDVIIG